MYKLVLIVIAVCSFVFADYLNNAARIDENSNSVKNQYCWSNASIGDDDKVEAGRRRGKRNRGDRRRGGGGLR